MCHIGAALALLFVLICTSQASWAARLGPEFQLNTFTTDYESETSVTALRDGGFVVAWSSYIQDGSSNDIFGQRFNSESVRLGSEFRVNARAAGFQYAPSVAGLADGGFIVTWDSDRQNGTLQDIYGQRFSATGIRVGDEFRVNSYTASHQYNSSVAGFDSGGFVVTWTSDNQDGFASGIYAQLYDPTGQRVGGEFRVNTTTTRSEYSPSVAALVRGGFVVVWLSNRHGTDPILYAQHFGATGRQVGGEFRVNNNTKPDHSREASVASLADGGFVAVWGGYKANGPVHIYGQRFNTTDARIGSEFRVNTRSEDYQSGPSVSGLVGGGFIVTWSVPSSNEWDILTGIFGQLYNREGGRVGTEFRANTTAASYAPLGIGHDNSSLGALSDGGFVVVWSAYGQDRSYFEIYGQRFGDLITAFPLGGPQTPTNRSSTAQVVSMFDHSMHPMNKNGEVQVVYSCDDIVVAFTGDAGMRRYGADQGTCRFPGYRRNSEGLMFDSEATPMPNVNYVGNREANGLSSYLNYDGHPGIDYRAALGTPVFAAASGVIKYPRKIVGSVVAYSTMHALALIPERDVSYRIYYLHLSTHPSTTPIQFPASPQPGCYKNAAGVAFTPTQLPLPAGSHVKAGCLIALSGDAGIPNKPHLHFEVQRIYPAAQVDPTFGTYLQCWNETGYAERDPNKICLPLDPYGWSGRSTDCSSLDPKNWKGDTYECLSRVSSDSLWR